MGCCRELRRGWKSRFSLRSLPDLGDTAPSSASGGGMRAWGGGTFAGCCLKRVARFVSVASGIVAECGMPPLSWEMAASAQSLGGTGG